MKELLRSVKSIGNTLSNIPQLFYICINPKCFQNILEVEGLRAFAPMLITSGFIIIKQTKKEIGNVPDNL
jgi:hypothetical protein